MNNFYFILRQPNSVWQSEKVNVELKLDTKGSFSSFKKIIASRNKFAYEVTVTVVWDKINWVILVNWQIITWIKLYICFLDVKQSVLKWRVISDQSLSKIKKDQSFSFSLL